jgi:hypothetical protein
MSLHVFQRILFCIFIWWKCNAPLSQGKLMVLHLLYTLINISILYKQFKKTLLSICLRQTDEGCIEYYGDRLVVVYISPYCYMGQYLLCLFPISRSACTEIRSLPPNKLNRYFCTTSTIWSIIAPCISKVVRLWNFFAFSLHFYYSFWKRVSVIIHVTPFYSWRIALHGKSPVILLLQNFPMAYGIQRLNTVFKLALYWLLFWGRLIQCQLF